MFDEIKNCINRKIAELDLSEICIVEKEERRLITVDIDKDVTFERFAHDKGLMLSGYSYKKGTNKSVIDRIEDYAMQIEIPVCH